MNIRIANTKYGNISYYKNDYYIAQSLENGIPYEEDVILSNIKNHIEKSEVILDIGAHIGCHSLVYASINKDAKIYSFELQEQIYKLLKQNIEDNNLSNIKVFNCAIGDSIKMVNVADKIIDGPNRNQLYTYDNEKAYNFGGVSIGNGSEHKLMITIDSLNLSGCDFIKIDVEGFEYFVVLGAINTIMKYKPVIFYEKNFKTITNYMSNVNDLTNIITKDMSVMNLLKSIGYKKFTRIDANILAEY